MIVFIKGGRVKNNQIVPAIPVENRIIQIRNQNVLIDADVAQLYGVETKYINRAVKNNPDKFPYGYILTLENREKSDVVQNLHHLGELKYSHAETRAFTEKGLYMLATILKSPAAVATTIAIIENFAKLRELQKTVAEMAHAPTIGENLIARSGKIISELVAPAIPVSESETTIEINLAVVKVKHTVKRNKKKDK
jgi:hypothetical protein